MNETAPQPIEYAGTMVAPVICGVCHGVEFDHHRLRWLPHRPPDASGHQHGIHNACFEAEVRGVKRVPDAMVRAIEEVP